MEQNGANSTIGRCVKRELALVKVVASGKRQEDALSVVGSWSGRLLELAPNHFTAELAGEPDRLTFFIDALAPFGTVTALRSGALSFEQA
jgi:acetolactate synthase-1/3 small subunit